MKDAKVKIPFLHCLSRFLIFPLLTGILYLIVRYFPIPLPRNTNPFKLILYTAAAISVLYLMAESILLFSKKRYQAMVCNASFILIIVFFIIFIFLSQ